MATLKAECKIFIVQSIACYETPTQVVESVRERFGIEITRQQVESHDPTKVSSKGLARKWIDIFNSTRERFRKETSDIPIANKAYSPVCYKKEVTKDMVKEWRQQNQ